MGMKLELTVVVAVLRVVVSIIVIIYIKLFTISYFDLAMKSFFKFSCFLHPSLDSYVR